MYTLKKTWKAATGNADRVGHELSMGDVLIGTLYLTSAELRELEIQLSTKARDPWAGRGTQ
mgnify:FL=1